MSTVQMQMIEIAQIWAKIANLATHALVLGSPQLVQTHTRSEFRPHQPQNGLLAVLRKFRSGSWFVLDGSGSVWEVQFPQLSASRAHATGLCVQARAGPIHHGEVAGDCGVSGSEPPLVPAPPRQRSLLQPELQLRAPGLRGALLRLPRAARFRERDEARSVSQALQTGPPSLPPDSSQQRNHGRVRETRTLQIPAVCLL